MRAEIGWQYGNVDKLDFVGSGVLQFQTMFPEAERAARGLPPFFRDRWLVASNLSFARASAENLVNSGFAHTRYTRMVIPRLGVEVFVQAQYNEFTLLRSRLLGGGGIRFAAVHQPSIRVWGGTGYMLEHEVNGTVEGDPHPRRLINHRWSSYGGLELRLAKDRIIVQETVYVQPLLTDFFDLRVLSDLGATGNVTELLSLGLVFRAHYDSRPPQTVERVDLSLRSVIALTFG